MSLDDAHKLLQAAIPQTFGSGGMHTVGKEEGLGVGEGVPQLEAAGHDHGIELGVGASEEEAERLVSGLGTVAEDAVDSTVAPSLLKT